LNIKKIRISLIFYQCYYTGEDEEIILFSSKEFLSQPLKVFVAVNTHDLKIAFEKSFKKNDIIFIVGPKYKVINKTLKEFDKKNLFINFHFKNNCDKNIYFVITNECTIFFLPENPENLKSIINFNIIPFLKKYSAMLTQKTISQKT
jgi:hypothetical protein